MRRRIGAALFQAALSCAPPFLAPLFHAPLFHAPFSITTLVAQTRHWRPEERALITDLSVVTAVAASRQIVYVATLGGLAIYDRNFLSWRETVGPLDGLPPGAISAMAADPVDDTAWLGGAGRWFSWQPFTRRLESGSLPGQVRQVVLDAENPSAGAWFGTTSGWYFVPRGGIVAERGNPPRRILPGALGPAELRQAVPAFDAIRSRIESDDLLRRYRVTSASRVAGENDVYLGTDGNGAFRVDGISHTVTRLGAGIVGERPAAVAAWRGTICVGGSGRGAAVMRSAVTCFDETLREPVVYEDRRALRFPGADIRRLLITERAVWAATNGGLVRIAREQSRTDVLDGAALPSNDVWALAAAAGGAWIGTTRGLAFVADTARVITTTVQLTGAPVLALALRGDSLLLGTSAGLAVLPPLAAAPVLVGPRREPVIGLAFAGDTLVAITQREVWWDAAGDARAIMVPGDVGVPAAITADGEGVWVAGSSGFGYYSSREGHWRTTSRGDVPVPVRDIAVSRGYVWVVTDAGLVRFDKRVLMR